MSFSPLTEQLIQALRILPGVGAKSAQRMALHLLERDREGARRLADSLASAVEGVGHCKKCRILTEDEICQTCGDSHRRKNIMCVVENPTDVTAIDASGGYEGLYFVLLGHLSPIDGIGPEDIGIDLLVERVTAEGISEVIIATSSTVEGEATAHYIANELEGIDSVIVSRIAHGIPMGGDIDHVDGHTLHHALASRQTIRA